MKFPKGSEKYQKVQADLHYYANPAIINRISKYLEPLHPSAILELGCGLGRMSVALKQHFKWDRTKFYLYDGDSEQDLKTDPWKGNNDTLVPGSFHNSLKLTKEFCLLNGIKANQLTLINAEKELLCNLDVKFDLICSFLAIGCHWPIKPFLDDTYRLLRPGGLAIFETPHGTKERHIRHTQRQIDSVDTDKFRILEADKPLIVIKKKG